MNKHIEKIVRTKTNMKKLHAKDEFVVGKNSIGWVSSSFKEHFYDLDFSPSTFNLARRTLERPMNDSEILKEIKPEAVLLGDVLYALHYLEKDDWCIFYVNDRKGGLWAVHALWDAVDGDWGVAAFSVGNPSRWRVGYPVLSRRFFDTLPSEETLRPLDSLTLEQRVQELEAWRTKVERVVKALLPE